MQHTKQWNFFCKLLSLILRTLAKKCLFILCFFNATLKSNWDISLIFDKEENIAMVERRRGKIELDFGLLVTFQIIRLDNLLKKSTNYSMVWAGIFWFSVKITFYCVDFYQKCLWLKMHSLRFILLLHQYLLLPSMCTVIIHIWYGIGLVFTYLHRLQIQFISFKVGSKDANGTVD